MSKVKNISFNKHFLFLFLLLIVSLIEKFIPKIPQLVSPFSVSDIVFLLFIPQIFSVIFKTRYSEKFRVLCLNVFFVSTLFGTLNYFGMFDTERSKALVGLYEYGMFVLLALYTISLCKKYKIIAVLTIFNIIIASSFVSCIIWLLQRYTSIIPKYQSTGSVADIDTAIAGSVAQFNGSFNWYVLFGAYAAFCSIISITLTMYYSKRKSKHHAVACFISFALNATCTLLVNSRGSILNLAIGLAFFGLFMLMSQFQSFLKYFFLISVPLIILYLSQREYINALLIRNAIQSDSADVTRLQLQEYAINNVTLKYFFGVGTEGFNHILVRDNSNLVVHTSDGSTVGFYHPHNIFLWAGTIGGILGFFSFTLLIFITVIKLFKAKTSILGLGALSTLLGFLAQNLSDTVTSQNIWITIFGVWLGICIYLSSNDYFRLLQLKRIDYK